MIILSVMSLVISWASLQSWLLYFLLNAVLYILKLYIVFHLCYGISELAGRRGLHEFQNKAIQRWRWYIIVITATFLILLIAPLAPLLAVILGILLILASLVIYILMMLLALEAEQVLHR